MKVKEKALRFSKKPVVLTKQDKRVKVAVTKQDYIRMLDEVVKWPLTCRIAAEIFRSGMPFRYFYDHLHLEGNTLSQRVFEHLTEFDMGRGPDPDRVTPVRPVYLRYVSPSSVSANALPKGRPSEEEAIAFIQRMIKKQVELGWKEIDFIKALRVIDEDSEDDVIKVAVKMEPDEPAEKAATVKPKMLYMIRVGGEWKQAASKQSLEKLKNEAAHLDVQQEPQKFCIWCKFPLNGLRIIKKVPETGAEFSMHHGCYWMNEVDPAEIPIGMRVMSPIEGVLYEWKSVEQSGKQSLGWIRDKKETSHSAIRSRGVPPLDRKEDKPSDVVEAPKDQGQPVHNVREAASIPVPDVRAPLPGVANKQPRKPAAKKAVRKAKSKR